MHALQTKLKNGPRQHLNKYLRKSHNARVANNIKHNNSSKSINNKKTTHNATIANRTETDTHGQPLTNN